MIDPHADHCERGDGDTTPGLILGKELIAGWRGCESLAAVVVILYRTRTPFPPSSGRAEWWALIHGRLWSIR